MRLDTTLPLTVEFTPIHPDDGGVELESVTLGRGENILPLLSPDERADLERQCRKEVEAAAKDAAVTRALDRHSDVTGRFLARAAGW